MTTELDIARVIAAGTMPSPTRFLNSAFYKIRVSGTGVAWRESIREFVYRPPSIWLSDEMVARCAGVPLVAGHPNKLALDGKAFFDSIIGILILGFVQGDELFAVARIIDARACAILDAGSYDTSPAVLFTADANTKLNLDGDELLIEEVPALLDHVALIDTGGGDGGVWTKAGAKEIGVEVN